MKTVAFVFAAMVLSGCISNGVNNFDKYHKTNNKLSSVRATEYQCKSPSASGYSTEEAMSKGVIQCRGE